MNNNATASYNDASKTVAVFCSIMAAILALTAYIIQSGYLFQLDIDNSHFYGSEHFFPPILSALVISIFLLNFPQAYRVAESKFKLPLKNTWLTSDAALSLLGLIILIVVGNIFSFYVLHVFYLISFLLFAYVFYSWFKEGNYKQNYIFIGISILFAIWLASLIWGEGWKDLLFFEKMIFIDKVHAFKCFNDPLSHSAIINMIQVHGIASTGVDGIPLFIHQTAGYWISVGIAKLLDAPTIVFQTIASPVIYLPFMFSSLLLLAINLKKWKEGTNLVNWVLRTDWKFWLIFFVFNIGIVPYRFSHNTGVLWYVGIMSASMFLGLAFFFLLLGLLSSFIRHNNVLIKRTDFILFLFILPFMIVLIGFIKLPIVLVTLPFLFYLFIRLRLYKIAIYNFSFVIISGIGVIFFIASISLANQVTSYHEHSVSIIDPFHLYRTWIKPSFWLYFLFFNCFWSILFVTLKLWYEKSINNVSHLRTLLVNRQLIDVEIIIVLCIIGLLPGMLFHMPPYNHPASLTANLYILDIQNWIALSFLLASIGKFNGIFNKKVKLFLLVPVLLGGYFFVSNYIFHIHYLYAEESHLSQLIKNNPDYLSTTQGRTLQLLHKIGRDMLLSEKKKTLVFIPQSNMDFWNIKLDACYGVPFLVPAITGMAMLDGFPPISCPSKHYGYDYYENNGIRTKKQTNTTDKALCSKTLEKGFSQILRIDNIYTQPRLISCGKQSDKNYVPN